MRDSKQDVLNFWFEECVPAQWFQKNPQFDEELKQRFLFVYDMAARDLCEAWSRDADGVLALCLVLDQFPRNMFRGHPQAFATDEKALHIAKIALHKGFDQVLTPVKRRFVYLPFEHSESLQDQERSVKLFESMKDSDPMGVEYALRHYEIIKKFGRFPHRNAILGRKSTPAEREYLTQSNAGF